MKHRKLVAAPILAAAPPLTGPLTPPRASHLSLSLNAAMDIAQHEIVRRGLAASYHVSALYADGDRRTEGAAFAVIVRPHASAPAATKRAPAPPRLKLLIHEDGRTLLRTLSFSRNRTTRRSDHG